MAIVKNKTQRGGKSINNTISIKPGRYDYLGCAMGGVLIALAFPDYGMWPLAWIGAAPFLASLPGKSPHHGALLGFVFGLASFGPTFTWMRNTMIDFGHIPEPLAWVVTLLAVVYLSAFTALAGYTLSWIDNKSKGAYTLAAAPFVWSTLETLRTYAYPLEFPWARIADTQYQALRLIQIADITGEEGVSLLIILVNSALAACLLWFTKGKKDGERFPWNWAIVAAVIFIGSASYGSLRLSDTAKMVTKKVKVALIQGNIDQARKWEESYIEEQVEIYFRRTRQAVVEGAELIAWPETAAPFYFGSGGPYDLFMRDLAYDTGRPIIFGAPYLVWKDQKRLTYNRAWALTPDGARSSYDKVHLVPFGEYVPFKKLLWFIEKMVDSVGNIEPGKAMTLLDAGEYKVGAQICYEVIFPAYSRTMTAAGADVIINITNDSWFGRSAASRQSLAMAVFRAVENRRPLLRAAQSGVSAMISPTGEVTAKTGLFVETTLYGEMEITNGRMTIYTLSGGLFGWLVVMTGVGIVCSLAIGRKANRN